MKEKREKRLNSEFRKEIYDILKYKVSSPFITEMFAVTDVVATNDLKYAKVFVSVFSTDAEKRAKTFAAILGQAKFVRSELSRTMRIRTVPELNFILDDSEEYGQKIDKILNTITYSDNEEE